MERKVLLLGGYGATGRRLARLFIDHTGFAVTIAGRRFEPAADLAGELGARAAALELDARDPAALREACAAHHLVVVASTTSDSVATVADAALETGCDYLDVLYPPEKLEVLRARESRIRNAGLSFVTEAGFHPGLPAALIRYGERLYHPLERCEIGSLIRMRIDPHAPVPASAAELAASFLKTKMAEFVSGEWKPISPSRSPYRPFDFGPPYGRKICIPMFFDEMRAAQSEIPTLTETRFLMAGFGPVIDYAVTPAILLLQSIAPDASRAFCGRILFKALARFTPQPYGTTFIAEWRSNGNVNRLRLFHRNEYEFTAIPVVAFLKQWYESGRRKPGLHYMGVAADPIQLIDDMRAMGIES